MIPTLDDIRDAARQVEGSVIRTPFLPSPRLSALTGARVLVKYENLQATASFKERGALVKFLSLTEAERQKGVVTMSAGNHAQAVAYHAQRLGIAATIVMPTPTPFVKIAATRGSGARKMRSTAPMAMRPAVRPASKHLSRKFRQSSLVFSPAHRLSA